ncbi:hypothetical protein Moror_4505 [Moniliophthora roreri MCA 2997]|uniref:Zn(2)-C6 fungal-type domain-containing protein n=1 Tax=Moniliophthora roreri (strain MCA 2997) TaxID=1381753 RepID=V2X018_MONRO|nr:hypothetical protein Moror_4505 [Moniliophthora roreri MCA 2997]
MTNSERSRSPTTAKKSGHSRNPMACTNCRARKIKCESNRQHPERPCQRCTNRKLHCEYVAISHPPPPPPTEKFHADPSSSIATPDSSRRTHTRVPSGHTPSSGPRYSPVSSSLSRKGSPRTEYEYLSSEDRSYHISAGDYAPNPGSTPRYNSYYPNATYNDSVAYSQGPNSHMPNMGSMYSPYSDPSISMNPGLLQNSGNFGQGPQEYLSWNSPVPNQLYYASCHCSGYCTCGTNRS